MKTFDLIGAQLALDGGRNRRHNPRLQFADAAFDFGHALGWQKFRGCRICQLQGMQPLRFCREIARVQAEPGQPFVLLGRELKLQPPPAFFAEPDKITMGIQESLDFGRRQLGPGNIQHHLQIEPIHLR